MSTRKISFRKKLSSGMALIVATGFTFAFSPVASAIPLQDAPSVDVEIDVEELSEDLEKFADSLEKKLSNAMESYGAEIEQWAEKYSAEMEQWGEKYASEMEQWAEKYSGEFEKFGEELEKKFSSLENELRNELEDSDSLKGVASELKKALNELGGIAENAVTDQVEMLQKKAESGADRAHQSSGSKNAADRKAYLADRIEEIKMRLNDDLPAEERKKLERALKEMDNLRASLKSQADEVSKNREEMLKDPATVKRLLAEKLQDEQRRHVETTRALKQELEKVQRLETERARQASEQAQRAAREKLERKKEEKSKDENNRAEAVQRLKVEMRQNKEKAAQDQGKLESGRKEKERKPSSDKHDEKNLSELEALRAEIKKLRSELDEIRKDR